MLIDQPSIACVCILADDRASLVPFETAAVNGAEVPMEGTIEYGRGQRNPAEKRMYSSDEDDDDGPTLPKQVLIFIFICVFCIVLHLIM